MDIRLKRAYEPASVEDGYRVLVDRLWPRGVSKKHAELDEWEKELSPSPELREWFGHEPSRFGEFRRCYIDELRANRPRLKELRRHARTGRLTLVYSARDSEHNDAVVLAEMLRRGLPSSKVAVNGPFLAPAGIGRRRPPRATVVLLTSIGAVLAVYGLIVGVVVRPPALGWVGFAIASAVVLGLGALMPLAFERTRVSPLRPARAVGRQKRLLVVADSHCNEDALCEAILAFGHAAAVHVVVPARVSRLHFVTDDENEERGEAWQSMRQTVGLLRQRAAAATGALGSDEPLESMTDALGTFPATRVLLATPPEGESYWLKRGLLTKARALTEIPVTQVVVPANAPANSVRRLSTPDR